MGAPAVILNDHYVQKVCQPGTERCCRYLTMGAKGWDCEKNTELAAVINERVRVGAFRAVGDNCAGVAQA